MNAQHTFCNTSTSYAFEVEHEGKTYAVTIWLNEMGRFIDDEIELNGKELAFEGEEGETREKIVNYLAENWDALVK